MHTTIHAKRISTLIATYTFSALLVALRVNGITALGAIYESFSALPPGVHIHEPSLTIL